MSTLNEQLKGSLALIEPQAAMPVVISNESLRIIQLAIERGAPIETLERLLAMKEKLEADDARKAFNAAVAAFKGDAVKILRTKLITDGPLKGKKHAELGAIVAAVTPALSRHGLSISWKLTKDDREWMEVACTLRHIGGHSESVTMAGAPDTGPGRNAIQARGSAKTYLERYTATAILGLAPEEDDDGRGAPEQHGEEMDGAAVDDFISMIEGSGDVDELQRNYFAARDTAQKIGDKHALHTFAEAKNKQYIKLTRRAK